MKTLILSILATGAAFTTVAIAKQPRSVVQQEPPAYEQVNTLAPQSKPRDGVLAMVMVDQSKLSGEQKQAFQQYLQTANLPRTKIGDRCQFYGRPDVWCLLLDPELGRRIFEQLKAQESFGAAVEVNEVGRLGNRGGGG